MEAVGDRWAFDWEIPPKWRHDLLDAQNVEEVRTCGFHLLRLDMKKMNSPLEENYAGMKCPWYQQQRCRGCPMCPWWSGDQRRYSRHRTPSQALGCVMASLAVSPTAHPELCACVTP
jgi:hypothetical protein